MTGMKFGWRPWSVRRFDDKTTTTWRWIGAVWRCQFRFVYRHRYPRSPDRWVFQPSFTYDRKERTSPVERSRCE